MDAGTILGIVLLIVGALVAISEIHTLTIYLLAVALACFVAAGVAFAGGGLSLSLIVLGIVILLGMPVAHWLRLRMKNHASEQVSQDDVGRTVSVVEVGAEGLRVSYRGSAWNARVQENHSLDPQVGQTLRIVAREGNTLVLGPQMPV